MGWQPIEPMQGASLRAAIAGTDTTFLPSFSESEYARFGFGWASLRSYTTERWKYIDAPKPELYDRRTDPVESSNVVAEHPGVATQMKATLDELVERIPKCTAEALTPDEESLRALQSLGYVGGGVSDDEATDDDIPRRNPLEMVHVFRGLTEAQRLSKQRRYEEVATLLEPLAAESPESDELFAVLGEAYLHLRRFRQAEQAYRNSLRRCPTTPTSSVGWATR